jgi:hypothetical protein
MEELRESSQLIVITHQKRTMEIADALYGVSMRGDGVTTVISQRLRDGREPGDDDGVHAPATPAAARRSAEHRRHRRSRRRLTPLSACNRRCWGFPG